MHHASKAAIIVGVIAFASAFGPAVAAENEVDEQAIDQIVVVAHKTERSIRDVAANVTILARQDLGLELATSIADALRYTPGIDYEGAGTRFGTEGINIRGIGGNRVALLIDGVPLSDQFDVGSFSNATRDFVNAGFIQRAEVLHGPASALYGSAAIGGVIALRSPDPADLAGPAGLGGNLATAWRGADSSLHGTALQTLRAGKVGILAGFSHRDGEENDAAGVETNLDTRDAERRSAMLKLVADDAAGNTWKIGYYGQDSSVRSSLSSMLGSGRFRSTTALEGDDDQRMDLLSAELGFGMAGGLIDAGIVRAYYGITDIEQKTRDERGAASRPVTIDRLFAFEQELRGVELNLQKSIAGKDVSHRIGFGLEYRERHTEEFRDGLETGLQDGLQTNVLLGEVFPLRDFPLSKSTDLGIYVEDVAAIGDWTLIGAVRADRYELSPRNDAMYAEDYPFATPVSLAESDISPKLGLIYRPSPQVDVYLQYAHGFRAPPYEDANIGLEIPLFNYRAIPNPDLKSESSDGLDLGLRWQGVAGSAHLSIFRTRYDDFIESKVRLGADPVSGRILFQSMNVSEALIEGVEAGGSLSFSEVAGGLSVDGSLYWARGENRDTGAALNSVGPAQAIIGVDWSSTDGDWRLRLKSTFTAGWSDRDESRGELFSPPGHAVFDLYASRLLGEHLQLRAGITNLADRKYWAWSDVRGLGPDDPVIPFLARPGRSLILGVDMDW